MDISNTELAWAAGFYDGEGSTTTAHSHNGRPIVSIGQKDAFVLERFREAMLGRGSITGPYPHNNGKSHIYRYRTTTYEDTQFVIALIWKWLSPLKRAQATTVFTTFATWYKANPSLYRGTGICKRGHDVNVTGTYKSRNARLCAECTRSRNRAKYHAAKINV